MPKLLRMLRANFTPKPVQTGLECSELKHETIEAYALRLVSQNFDFHSEDHYLEAAASLSKLGREVALDRELSAQSRSNPGKLRLVVNNGH